MVENPRGDSLAYLLAISPALLNFCTLVFIIYLVQRRNEHHTEYSRSRSRDNVLLSRTILLLYIGDGVIFIVDNVMSSVEDWPHRQITAIYLCASFFANFVNHIYRMNGNHSFSLSFCFLGMCTEAFIFVLRLHSFKLHQISTSDFAKMISNALRASLFGGMALLHFRYLSQRSLHISAIQETTPLIQRAGCSGYGDAISLRDYFILLPFLWPSNHGKMVMAICFLLALLGRAASLAIPVNLGAIVEAITAGQIPWRETRRFGLLLLLEPQLSVLRSYLWNKLKMTFYRHLAIHSFRHLMNLDTEYHFSTNTAEAISDIQRSSSVTRLLELITISAVPTIASLAGSLFYLWAHYDIYYAFLVVYGAICYLWVTLSLTSITERTRRGNIQHVLTLNKIQQESVSSWLSIIYLGDLIFYTNRYYHAMKDFQGSELRNEVVRNLLRTAQRLIMILWTLSTLLFAARQIILGRRPPSLLTTMFFLTKELQYPISEIFDIFFVAIQATLIDLERLVRLLYRKPEVIDEVGALDLSSYKGSLCFKNVHFSSRSDGGFEVLRGINFNCEPGSTTAIVGPTGSGKSTLFNLIFRFHDVTEGSISFDEHNIADITKSSLRRHIGIVPQPPQTSNRTVMENVRRARSDATEEQIIDACKAAAIHSSIMNFPDGYETVVGEGGLRLSGGERQRLEIALTNRASLFIRIRTMESRVIKRKSKTTGNHFYLKSG